MQIGNTSVTFRDCEFRTIDDQIGKFFIQCEFFSFYLKIQHNTHKGNLQIFYCLFSDANLQHARILSNIQQMYDSIFVSEELTRLSRAEMPNIIFNTAQVQDGTSLEISFSRFDLTLQWTKRYVVTAVGDLAEIQHDVDREMYVYARFLERL